MRADTQSLIAILAILSHGCVFLPESSLIYGSKTVFGIGLGTDAAGSPFTGFNVGYSSHDFAKVPIAVQSRDDEADSIEIIWGSSCSTTEALSSCHALFEHDKALFADVDYIAKTTGRPSGEVRSALESTSFRPLADSKSLAVFEIDESIPEEVALARFRESAVASLEPENPEEAKQIAATVEKATSIKPPSSIVRRDAYSVFGSFNTDAKTNSAQIGKIFATGVAAQAVADATTMSFRARCVQHASQAKDAAVADVKLLCGSAD